MVKKSSGWHTYAYIPVVGDAGVTSEEGCVGVVDSVSSLEVTDSIKPITVILQPRFRCVAHYIIMHTSQ